MITKKIKYIPIVISLISLYLMFMLKPAIADDKNKKTSRIGKRDNFTHDTRIRNYKIGDDHIKGAPPDPGGGGDGWPIPIGDGIGFLIFGGIAYLFIKKRTIKNKINK